MTKFLFRREPFTIWPAVLILTVLFGCEPHEVISVDEKVPPTFNFSGRGRVPFFVVAEVEGKNADEINSDRAKYNTLWRITPNDMKAAMVPIGPITYGIVPPGWTQAVPAQGSPPPLLEGRVYYAGGPAIEMPEGVVQFRIVGGKVVRY